MISTLKDDNILRNSDEIDSEASPIPEKKIRVRNLSKSGEGSLNTSTVEQEGRIDSSPKKNPTNQLVAGQDNPFTDKMANDFQKKIANRNIKIVK